MYYETIGQLDKRAAGVLISGGIIFVTGWTMIDSIFSLIIIGFILYANYNILLESLHLCFDGVPKHVKIEDIRKYFKNLKYVKSFHELHVWSISSTEHCLTIHLVVKGKDSIIDIPFIMEELKEKFNIQHVTIQTTEFDCCRKNTRKCN